MMILIDAKILSAMKKAVKQCGSQSELARRSGLGKQHISKYLKGDVRQIEDATWKKLSPFLDCETGFSAGNGCRSIFEVLPGIPVVTEKQLMHYDAALTDLKNYVSSLSHAFFPVRFNPEAEITALRFTGSDHEPFFPEGTILCFDGNGRPLPGDHIIGMLKNPRKIVFLKCEMLGSRKKFEMLSPDRGSFQWEKASENPFLWLYPVKAVFWAGRK